MFEGQQRPTSGRGKKVAISQSDCSHIRAIVTLFYRTHQWTLGYDTVIRRTWVMAAGRNFASKIAAKPLQTCLLLILTTYRNASSLCLTIADPYDLPFSYNTCITHRKRRTTHRTKDPTLAVGQKLTIKNFFKAFYKYIIVTWYFRVQLDTFVADFGGKRAVRRS